MHAPAAFSSRRACPLPEGVHAMAGMHAPAALLPRHLAATAAILQSACPAERLCVARFSMPGTPPSVGTRGRYIKVVRGTAGGDAAWDGAVRGRRGPGMRGGTRRRGTCTRVDSRRNGFALDGGRAAERRRTACPTSRACRPLCPRGTSPRPPLRSGRGWGRGGRGRSLRCLRPRTRPPLGRGGRTRAFPCTP